MRADPQLRIRLTLAVVDPQQSRDVGGVAPLVLLNRSTDHERHGMGGVQRQRSLAADLVDHSLHIIFIRQRAIDIDAGLAGERGGQGCEERAGRQRAVGRRLGQRLEDPVLLIVDLDGEVVELGAAVVFDDVHVAWQGQRPLALSNGVLDGVDHPAACIFLDEPLGDLASRHVFQIELGLLVMAGAGARPMDGTGLWIRHPIMQERGAVDRADAACRGRCAQPIRHRQPAVEHQIHGDVLQGWMGQAHLLRAFPPAVIETWLAFGRGDLQPGGAHRIRIQIAQRPMLHHPVGIGGQAQLLRPWQSPLDPIEDIEPLPGHELQRARFLNIRHLQGPPDDFQVERAQTLRRRQYLVCKAILHRGAEPRHRLDRPGRVAHQPLRRLHRIAQHDLRHKLSSVLYHLRLHLVPSCADAPAIKRLSLDHPVPDGDARGWQRQQRRREDQRRSHEGEPNRSQRGDSFGDREPPHRLAAERRTVQWQVAQPEAQRPHQPAGCRPSVQPLRRVGRAQEPYAGHRQREGRQRLVPRDAPVPRMPLAVEPLAAFPHGRGGGSPHDPAGLRVDVVPHLVEQGKREDALAEQVGIVLRRHAQIGWIKLHEIHHRGVDAEVIGKLLTGDRNVADLQWIAPVMPTNDVIDPPAGLSGQRLPALAVVEQSQEQFCMVQDGRFHRLVLARWIGDQRGHRAAVHDGFTDFRGEKTRCNVGSNRRIREEDDIRLVQELERLGVGLDGEAQLRLDVADHGQLLLRGGATVDPLDLLQGGGPWQQGLGVDQSSTPFARHFVHRVLIRHQDPIAEDDDQVSGPLGGPDRAACRIQQPAEFLTRHLPIPLNNPGPNQHEASHRQPGDIQDGGLVSLQLKLVCDPLVDRPLPKILFSRCELGVVVGQLAHLLWIGGDRFLQRRGLDGLPERQDIATDRVALQEIHRCHQLAKFRVERIPGHGLSGLHPLKRLHDVEVEPFQGLSIAFERLGHVGIRLDALAGSSLKLSHDIDGEPVPEQGGKLAVLRLIQERLSHIRHAGHAVRIPKECRKDIGELRKASAVIGGGHQDVLVNAGQRSQQLRDAGGGPAAAQEHRAYRDARSLWAPDPAYRVGDDTEDLTVQRYDLFRRIRGIQHRVVPEVILEARLRRHVRHGMLPEAWIGIGSSLGDLAQDPSRNHNRLDFIERQLGHHPVGRRHELEAGSRGCTLHDTREELARLAAVHRCRGNNVPAHATPPVHSLLERAHPALLGVLDSLKLEAGVLLRLCPQHFERTRALFSLVVRHHNDDAAAGLCDLLDLRDEEMHLSAARRASGTINHIVVDEHDVLVLGREARRHLRIEVGVHLGLNDLTVRLRS